MRLSSKRRISGKAMKLIFSLGMRYRIILLLFIIAIAIIVIGNYLGILSLSRFLALRNSRSPATLVSSMSSSIKYVSSVLSESAEPASEKIINQQKNNKAAEATITVSYKTSTSVTSASSSLWAENEKSDEIIGIDTDNSSTLNNLETSRRSERAETSITIPRLLCWIMVSPDTLKTKAIYIRDTWGQRCDIILYMSSKENKRFPAVGLNVPEGKGNVAIKSRAAWEYVYEHYYNKADFFLKADPDAYVFVDHLKAYLMRRNSSSAEIYGHALYYSTEQLMYVAGGCLAITRESLRRLVTQAFIQHSSCFNAGHSEDLKTSQCLRLVGGKVIDTRDLWGRETFYTLGVYRHRIRFFEDWYKNYRQPIGLSQGKNCCSEYPVAYHYVPAESMPYLDDVMYGSETNHLANEQRVKNLYATKLLKFNGTSLTVNKSKSIIRPSNLNDIFKGRRL